MSVDVPTRTAGPDGEQASDEVWTLSRNAEPNERFHKRLARGLGTVFLCAGPVVFFLEFWQPIVHQVASGEMAYGAVTALYWLVYVRVLINTTSRKFLPGQAKGKRSFDGPVDSNDLSKLLRYCQRREGIPTASQINYFALSILSPRVIRRRVTDEFVPSRRTVKKTVSVEIDLDQRLVPWPTLTSSEPNEPTEATDPPADTQLTDKHYFVALTKPRKGVLYDNLLVLDGNGHALPSLSHREYRLLVALTFRSLLNAAFGEGILPNKALRAERLGLTELVRFAWFDRRPNETSAEYRERREDRTNKLTRVVNEIADLHRLGAKPEYLQLAAELVWQLAQSYAIVAVVPGPANGNGSRFIVRYERTLIPRLRLANLFSGQGVKDRLRMFLGARPVFLAVNARNAGTCQSYHLQIAGPPELYVGDFSIKSITEAADQSADDAMVEAGVESVDHMQPYWRLRGRRGQHYFHLYARAIRPRKPNNLAVTVKFFEVPPGSIARAGVAAIATFIATLAVAFAVSKTSNLDLVDGQVAVFLLAAPGIAAAWLGFEPRPGLLLDGTLAARLSTVATFVLSIAGSVVLLLNRAEVFPVHRARLLVFMEWDATWTVIVIGAFMNMLVTGYAWWQRSQYYQRVAVRSTDDSSLMPNE